MKWVTPQQLAEDPSVSEAWRKRYPVAPLSEAFRATEWAGIDTWETPTFYFYKNGKLRSKLTGWPNEGRKAQFLEIVRELEAEVR